MQRVRFPPFIRLNNIPLYRCVTLPLSIPLLIDRIVVSIILATAINAAVNMGMQTSLRGWLEFFWIYAQEWDAGPDDGFFGGLFVCLFLVVLEGTSGYEQDHMIVLIF